jgi:hypothetical protein
VCYLDGYPELTVSGGTDRHKMRVVRGTGGVYADVKPRRVTIQPGEDASFGVVIGDAANQQDPNTAVCTIEDFETQLPTDGPGVYENVADFNICHADFLLVITAIQSGPLPKEE